MNAWREFEKYGPPDGVRLILKMAEADNSISYAIGMLDHRDGKLKILAQENAKATRPIYWMQIPD
jgi:hypothetical protein